MEDLISAIDETIRLSERIVITTHRSPDGDAIGSSLAMYHYLKDFKKVNVITPDDYPSYLHWLPEDDKVINFESNKDFATKITHEADLIICLDMNVLDRLEKYADCVRKTSCKKILIDHHPNPGDCFNLIYSRVNTSSTAEMVYEFLSKNGDSDKINKDIAKCLYVGIMTDTGSFKFSSTSASTHRIVADLIDKGLDVADIQKKIFDNNSKNRMELLGYALSNKMQVFDEYYTCILSLDKKELKRFNAQKGDTEGFVNIALSLKNITMAVFVTEKKEGGAKMSFRSKGAFRVNELAKKHFEGGGHINAAGGSCKCSLQETINKLVSVLPEYENELADNAG